MRRKAKNMNYAVNLILLTVLLAVIPVEISAYTVGGSKFMDKAGKPVKIIAVEVPYMLAMDDAKAGLILEKLAKTGIKTVKIPASYTGAGKNKFYIEPGKYNEEMFKKLDNVIDAASKLGISLIISLADNSPEYGGIEAYTKWTGASNSGVFFKDAVTIKLYKQYISFIMKRINTKTKKPYVKDDTVLAWDICNHASGTGNNERTALIKWATEISSYIKELDKAHMVVLSTAGLNTQKGELNDFDLSMIPALDFVIFGWNDKLPDWENQLKEQSGILFDNINKPVCAYLSCIPASVPAAVTAFLDSSGDMLVLSYAGFEDYGKSEGAIDFEDAAVIGMIKTVLERTGKEMQFRNKIALNGIKAAPAAEYVEFTIPLREKTDIEILFGVNPPFISSSGIIKYGAPWQKIRVDGLAPDTDYSFLIMVKNDSGSGITAVKKLRTLKLVRAKALPFTRSKNIMTAKNGSFFDGKNKFRYMGANNYHVRYSNKRAVDRFFMQAQKLGLKVIRVGAGGETTNMSYADKNNPDRILRTGPDSFNESAYKKLDYLVDSASRNNMRVIIYFEDNRENNDVAGVYAKWAGLTEKEKFWTDPKCRELFRQTIDSYIKRKNTVNGKLYSDDPTIFAYDIMNGFNYKSDKTEKTITAWVEEMSSYIRSVDPDHMITIGAEASGSGVPASRDGESGPMQIYKLKNIDFCTFYMFPARQNNYSLTDVKEIIENSVKNSHKYTGKPAVMGSYGVPNNDPNYPKTRWIEEMTDAFFAAGGDGVNYWFLSDPVFTGGDGDEVSFDQTGYMNVFIENANKLNEKGL